MAKAATKLVKKPVTPTKKVVKKTTTTTRMGAPAGPTAPHIARAPAPAAVSPQPVASAPIVKKDDGISLWAAASGVILAIAAIILLLVFGTWLYDRLSGTSSISSTAFDAFAADCAAHSGKLYGAGEWPGLKSGQVHCHREASWSVDK